MIEDRPRLRCPHCGGGIYLDEVDIVYDPLEGIHEFWAKWGEVLLKRPSTDWEGSCYQEMVQAIKKVVGK